MKKRFLSILLATIMMLTLIPATVFADPEIVGNIITGADFPDTFSTAWANEKGYPIYKGNSFSGGTSSLLVDEWGQKVLVTLGTNVSAVGGTGNYTCEGSETGSTVVFNMNEAGELTSITASGFSAEAMNGEYKERTSKTITELLPIDFPTSMDGAWKCGKNSCYKDADNLYIRDETNSFYASITGSNKAYENSVGYTAYNATSSYFITFVMDSGNLQGIIFDGYDVLGLDGTYTVPPTTSITAVKAAAVSYDMVIPSNVAEITAAGIYKVGTPKVENVQNATEKTVISYIATGTDFKKSDDATMTMAAHYYTDSEGTTDFPNTPITVYKNQDDVDSLTDIYVGIDDADWNKAEAGTYNASVIFDFSAEEVEEPKAYFAGTLTTSYPGGKSFNDFVNKDGAFSGEGFMLINNNYLYLKSDVTANNYYLINSASLEVSGLTYNYTIDVTPLSEKPTTGTELTNLNDIRVWCFNIQKEVSKD